MTPPSLEPAFILRSDRYVVMDKPCGWLSIPSRRGEDDARPCVGRWLEGAMGKRVFPVHRLDEPVSGLILFALDADAHRVANGWFEHGFVHKTYEAWSEVPRPGDAPPAGFDAPLPLPVQGQEVLWTSLLAKGKKRAYVEAKLGKKCLTMAKLVSAQGPYLRWELAPRTGRPHQLRFELFQRGSPIVGDALYGSRTPSDDGIALRAFRLDLRDCKEASALGLPQEVEVGGLPSPVR
jgi:tRNA pseudouridine32 synthase/23S rRNA pseudouridine746 synthase